VKGHKGPPSTTEGPLVLLRHEIGGSFGVVRRARQHGHRWRLLARAAVSLRRTDAMELDTWRSGRTGSASGSVMGVNGSLPEAPGGTRS
jgi:hypothetical protein